tara:strand:- start:7119 stop:8159 length:1041 start_codon:yes stop_codon:yes gene_type:complete
MIFLKLLLYPSQIIYSLIIFTRNKLYDFKLIKSYKSKITTISIGNLKTGGTGKTPIVEYLIRLFNKKNIAVLSRGYKRKTKGFILVNKKHQADDVGDENRQLYNKYPTVKIACDENRVNGAKKLEEKFHSLDYLILDDAYQHRSLERDINILLTEYSDLYLYDQLLPAGRLRESRKQVKRANIIIITKSPRALSIRKQNFIINKIKPRNNQKIYFSYIKEYLYIEMLSLKKLNLNKNQSYLLVTGIENPQPLTEHLRHKQINYHHLQFTDHHNFNKNDINKILSFKGLKNTSSNLLITEKDFYRLSVNQKEKLEKKFKLICIQIEFDFIATDKANFNNQLINFEKI